MKEKKVLLLRADGSPQIGTGHLMRCLALGQAWRKAGGEVLFITACREEGLLHRLSGEGFAVHSLKNPYPHQEDLEVTGPCLEQHPGAWFVLDGYHFDGGYHQRAKAAGARLMIIDDMAHLPHYEADIILNQNIQGPDLSYSAGLETKLLRGTPYALLRREFLGWKDWKREIPGVARKILVTLGGSDPDNATLKVVRGLQGTGLPGLEVAVVVGATNPNREKIEKETTPLAPAFRLLTAVEDMPHWMAWADMAVSAAGSTVWEMAFMGLPNLALVLADNQLSIAEKLGREGISMNLGWAHRLSPAQIGAAARGLALAPEKRREMAEKGRTLVDGLGGSRVAREMKG